MTRILLRPFRLETWRELAFVLLGGLMAIVGFCVHRRASRPGSRCS